MSDDLGRRPIPARDMRSMQRIAKVMATRGLTPNMISAFGLVAGVSAGLLLGLTQVIPDAARVLWMSAAILILLRGLSNMFDGMVAVEHGQGTPAGLFWNEIPDRVSGVSLFVGAGYSLGGDVVAGWIVGCLALFVAYVRTMAVLAGAPADFGGPFAKQQRMFSIAILASVLALVPEAWRFAWGPEDIRGPMAALLWVLVPGCLWTIVRRLRTAARAVSQTDHQ